MKSYILWYMLYSVSLPYVGVYIYNDDVSSGFLGNFLDQRAREGG